jgi:hypothetical protein
MNEGEFQRGVDEARADIAARAMRYFFQTRGAWGEKFTELMRERFGVQVVPISDITCDAEQSYQQGYNSTIKSQHLGRNRSVSTRKLRALDRGSKWKRRLTARWKKPGVRRQVRAVSESQAC